MSAERTDKFILAEYSALREEVKWTISQVEVLERSALIFTGAIWAWFASQTWRSLHRVLVFLPLVLTVLFLIKRESLRRSLRECAKYLLKIETYFDLPDGMGWDHELNRKRVRHFRIWKTAFWSLLIVFNLFMAILTLWLKL